MIAHYFSTFPERSLVDEMKGSGYTDCGDMLSTQIQATVGVETLLDEGQREGL